MNCTSCPCCPANAGGGSGGGGRVPEGLPLICLVPRDAAAGAAGSSRPRPASARAASSQGSDFQLLSEDYIKKHFDLPPRAMYLDAFRRPLITFPLNEDGKNFNMAKKGKINQMILDGFLDPSEAISAPSVFPYGKTEHEKRLEAEEEDEIIYILQLPDYEFRCPTHNQTIRTPRFIWHSCKKGGDKGKGGAGTDKGEKKRGGGPMNKPKPWLLSRHTDFDMESQW